MPGLKVKTLLEYKLHLHSRLLHGLPVTYLNSQHTTTSFTFNRAEFSNWPSSSAGITSLTGSACSSATVNVPAKN